MAAVDSASISARPCFLCRSNRPPQQSSILMLAGRYELLVNPFPIFSPHFVIASTEHAPQYFDSGVHADMLAVAGKMPGMAVFFNGARCGASAPDHLHFQAVGIDRLPLLQAIAAGEHLPFEVRHTTDGTLPGFADQSMVNALVWTDPATGISHTAIVPRRAHRPWCYNNTPEGILVSPATIDLGGVVVVPRADDFGRIDTPTLNAIINDVTFPAP